MAMTAVDNNTGNQQVATQSSASKNSANSVSASGAAGVGTARDDKRSTMNTDLNLPDMIASASAATVSNTTPEVNILLSSNNDFEDALKQVIHIAQLSDATGGSTVTPTRVAIELQTPPGAIVNVYVSKQDDGYRAQLSTSDPAALSWVQDKIASLRQGDDLGVQVKWLPAQIESSSLSATTTSSDSSNLNWNRDGQQQNNPTPDDRSQYQRQAPSPEDDLTEAEADTFATNLQTVGGLA
jgi:hypothetical protein